VPSLPARGTTDPVTLFDAVSETVRDTESYTGIATLLDTVSATVSD
jgi:hypothetical protein